MRGQGVGRRRGSRSCRRHSNCVLACCDFQVQVLEAPACTEWRQSVDPGPQCISSPGHCPQNRHYHALAARARSRRQLAAGPGLGGAQQASEHGNSSLSRTLLYIHAGVVRRTAWHPSGPEPHTGGHATAPVCSFQNANQEHPRPYAPRPGLQQCALDGKNAPPAGASPAAAAAQCASHAAWSRLHARMPSRVAGTQHS